MFYSAVIIKCSGDHFNIILVGNQFPCGHHMKKAFFGSELPGRPWLVCARARTHARPVCIMLPYIYAFRVVHLVLDN